MAFTATMYPEPPPAPPPRPRRFPNFTGEWRIAREATHLALAAPILALAQRGHGEPVMLSPGWRAPQSSMEPLRRFLALKGYSAEHWGRGINRGDVQADVDSLVTAVAARAEREQCPVALVGWSLGGVVSREIAREIPESVSCVITFGSPVVGGPSYTATAPTYSAAQRAEIRRRIAERERRNPISVPLATIFSRIDEIVHWPACIDRLSPDVVHYEVKSTHLSMGIDPAVWRVVLDRLAAHAGNSAEGTRSR